MGTHELAASLEATETFLRVLASNTLPFRSVLAVERLSLEGARRLLTPGWARAGQPLHDEDDAEADSQGEEVSYVEEDEQPEPQEDQDLNSEHPPEPDDLGRYFRYATPAPAPVAAAPTASRSAGPSFVDFDGPVALNAEDESEADPGSAEGEGAEDDREASGFSGDESDDSMHAFDDEEVTFVADASEIARLREAAAPTPVRAARTRMPLPPRLDEQATPVPPVPPVPTSGRAAPPRTAPPAPVRTAPPAPTRTAPPTPPRSAPPAQPRAFPTAPSAPPPPTRSVSPPPGRSTLPPIAPVSRSVPPTTARVMIGAPPAIVDVDDAGDEDLFAEETYVEPSPPPVIRLGTPRPAIERTPAPSAARLPVAATLRTPAATPLRAGGPSARVTAGLYGDPSVPRIRDAADQRPRAAAIQINADQGTGRVLGQEEEEEAIEIGDLGDYGEEEVEDAGSGEFRLDVQQYDDAPDEEPEEEMNEDTDETGEPLSDDSSANRMAANEVYAALMRARESVEAGDLARGAELYSDLIDLDPGNVDAQIGRGRLFLDLGDFSRSMSDFMTAEDLAPDSPEPQIAVGDLYFARKDYRKAISFFDSALEKEPNHAMALCRRGISHYYRKNHPVALQDLSRAYQLDPEIPNIQTYLSMAKKRSGR